MIFTCNLNGYALRSSKQRLVELNIPLTKKKVSKKRKMESLDPIDYNYVYWEEKDECKNDSYLLPVCIDFDEAHEHWVENKKKTKYGTYVYKCGYMLKNNKKCQRTCHDNINMYSGCKTHYMWEEK